MYEVPSVLNTGLIYEIQPISILVAKSNCNLWDIFRWFVVADISLVPRPSHCPVFDRLQYAKIGGGRPGPFYHVNDIVSPRLTEGGRGPRLKEHILHMRSLF